MKNAFAFLLIFLVTKSVSADMTCDTDISRYWTWYEINSYTCQSGYYLPANADGCVACPTGFTCSGGTFDFNPDIFQGLNLTPSIPNTTMNNICANNFPTKIYTEYVPNEHTCGIGYYLPANVDECTQCPAGSHCDSAGTYTFDSANDQGIESCPNGYTSSDSGATASTQCYRVCTTSDILHSTGITGNVYYDGTSGDGVNTCVPTSCDSGYHVDSASCVANTITVRWGGQNGALFEENTCTYGGTLYTPTIAPVAPKGHHFTGWTFDLGN